MKNMIRLIILLLVSCQGLSQDTLSSIPIIEYNGEVGLFLDSTNTSAIAHRLEDGFLAKEELKISDSLLVVSDSLQNVTLNVVDNLEKSLSLQEEKVKLEQKKTSVWIDKYGLLNEENRKLSRQRILYGVVGILTGSVIMVLVGI